MKIAKNIHAYHNFRLKKNTKASVANTGIDSQSIITHDAVSSVDSTTVSGKETSNTGLENLNKKRCNKKLKNIKKM